MRNEFIVFELFIVSVSQNLPFTAMSLIETCFGCWHVDYTDDKEKEKYMTILR